MGYLTISVTLVGTLLVCTTWIYWIGNASNSTLRSIGDGVVLADVSEDRTQHGLPSSSEHTDIVDEGCLDTAVRELDQLRMRMSGEIHFPSDEGYEASHSTYFGMGAELPLAFVLPKSNEDAKEVVLTMARNNISTRIQSGGHTYSSESVQGELGVTISTALLKTIELDADRKKIHVGAGCDLGEVYEVAHKSGFIFIGGTHASTGVAGYTLGGGQSTLSRYYGLAIDQLVEFELITPDGQLLVVREDGPYSDLFWAVRGGGNGNFGLVTNFVFKLYDQTDFPDVTEGTFYFNIANNTKLTSEMLNSYVNRHHSVSHKLSMRLAWGQERRSEMNGNAAGAIDQDTSIVDLYLVCWWYYHGPAAEARVAIEDYLSMYSDDFVDIENIQYDSIKHATYNPYENTDDDDTTSAADGENIIAPHEGWIAGSVYMNQSTPQVAKHIINFFAQENNARTDCKFYKSGWGFTPLGGQVGKVGKTDTAFWAREAEVELEVYIKWIGEEQDTSCRKAMNTLLDQIEEWSQTAEKKGFFLGAYINHSGDGLKDWRQKFYGDNQYRLKHIAEKYNPDGFGNWQYSITNSV